MSERKVRESTPPMKSTGNMGKGRVKGVPNKATASIRDIARQYTEEAMMALVEVIRTETGAARVSAVKEIFDRGYGKSTTILAGEGPDGAIVIAEIARRIIK